MTHFHRALLLIGSAFLGWLIWRVGPGELWSQLLSLGWGALVFILCEGIAETIHTVGWRHCLSGPHRHLSLLSLFRIRLAGYAINYLTPSAALGGEVTKAALLTAHQKGPDAITGVLVGKVCFAIAHLLFVCLGLPIILLRLTLSPPLWTAMLVSGCLVGGGIVAFLLLQKYGKLGLLIRWLAARKKGQSRLQTLSARISEVDEALKSFYRERSGDLQLAVGWHLLGFSIGIAQTWFFFYLLGREMPGWTAAAIWFVGMWFDLLTFSVPMNVGTLEGSRILVLKGIDYDPIFGLSYGVALRLAQLTWAVIGMLSYGFYALKESSSDTPREQPPPSRDFADKPTSLE